MASVNKVILVGNLGRDCTTTFPGLSEESFRFLGGESQPVLVYSLAIRLEKAERDGRRRQRMRPGWAGVSPLASSFFSNRKPDLRNAP